MSPYYVGPANGGRKIYGPLSSAPSSGLTDGDEYYNTSEKQKYIYSAAVNSFVKINHPTVGISIADPFNDSSAIATFNFDGNATALSGTTYSGTLAGDNSSGNFSSGGKFGQFFNATGTNHLLTTSSNISPSAAHSVSFWYKSNNTGQNNKRLVTVKGPSSGLASGWNNYNNSLGFYTGSGNSSSSTAASVTRVAEIPDASVNNNVWHHLAYTINATNSWTIYLDGSSYSGAVSGEGRSFNSGSFLAVTTYDGGDGYNTIGGVDQLRIFNRVLTAAEVSALYNET